MITSSADSAQPVRHLGSPAESTTELHSQADAPGEGVGDPSWCGPKLIKIKERAEPEGG